MPTPNLNSKDITDKVVTRPVGIFDQIVEVFNIQTTSGVRKDVSSIDEMLQSAAKIYSQSLATSRELLYQRVELGRVLIRLKDAVGHGNFIPEFKNWAKAGRIGFSLKTAQRAMAYAKMEAAGKFVDDAKNDIVSNLAEAERLRKAEAAKKKEENNMSAEVAQVSEQESDGITDDAGPVTLKKSQIGPQAKKLARPILEECKEYDGDTQTKLLEELIELLTEELEKCSNES